MQKIVNIHLIASLHFIYKDYKIYFIYVWILGPGILPTINYQSFITILLIVSERIEDKHVNTEFSFIVLL